MPDDESLTAAAKQRTITVKPVFVRVERPSNPDQSASDESPADTPSAT